VIAMTARAAIAIAIHFKNRDIIIGAFLKNCVRDKRTKRENDCGRKTV
jgi:hypothetical protein